METYGTQCDRKPPRISVRVLFASVAVSSALVACASFPNPTSEMATARAAVDNARRAGAGELAPTEMGSAQTLLTRAERAQAAEEYQTAKRAAEQAQATAQLAEERARLARANQAKNELDSTLKALRSDTQPRTR